MGPESARKLEPKMNSESAPMLCRQDGEHAESEETVGKSGVLLGSQRRANGAVALITLAALLALITLGILAATRQSRGRGPTEVFAQSVFLAEQAQGKRAPPATAQAGRICRNISGVKVAEPTGTRSVWAPCSAKWSENCKHTGCCADWGTKCFQKEDKWAACKEACQAKDEKNETWTCWEVPPPKPRTAESCFAECAEDKQCKQAIYNSDAGGFCLLSETVSTKIAWAGDNFWTAFCGDEEEPLQKSVKAVNANLPWELPASPVKNCSWGGEDCSQTKCCNDVYCDEAFTGCYGYSCYKKDQYFAGCSLQAPPPEWDGAWIGGARERRNIPAAGSQVAVQGTSLYCFSVVNWNAGPTKAFWAAERDLANNIRSKGLSIFQCDESDYYDGYETPVAQWGSFSNIDAFQKIWKDVQANGKYKNHDWVVKVDCDAVFFPQRLKWHLQKLRTPKGARVYLENTWFRFKFMGALEVLTKQALDLYLERSDSCLRGDHAGGEDFFMKGCMDALGIDHQEDYELLRDRYAAQNGPCTNGWTVAYHYQKKLGDWNWCYNEAMCGTGQKTCPEGTDL